MPIYEYRCEKCGKVFEVLQRFSDAPVKIHEGCGGEVEKLISHSAFQLKGSGWYQTDYAKGSSKAPIPKGDGKTEGGSPQSKSSDSNSEGSSGSKNDSKSESKSDSKKSESKSDSKTDSKPAVTTTGKTD